MKVVGVSKYDFMAKDRDTGKDVKLVGYTIHLTSPFGENNDLRKGVSVATVSVSVNNANELYNGNIYDLVGKEVVISYNQYKKPVSIQLVK